MNIDELVFWLLVVAVAITFAHVYIVLMGLFV